MIVWVLALLVSHCIRVEPNKTDENYKDMYVIRATTYQVGILTNETVANNITAGEQEAVTFYRKNGSDIDFNKIAPPIITNVTGQRVVSVALVPVLKDNDAKPWVYLNHILYGQSNSTQENEKNDKVRAKRDYEINTDDNNYHTDYEANKSDSEKFNHDLLKRSTIDREEIQNKTLVKIIQGSAIIPPDAAIKAIDIPPLLSFRGDNLSSIPVPIPNTSIVQYTKINTVVKPDNKD